MSEMSKASPDPLTQDATRLRSTLRPPQFLIADWFDYLPARSVTLSQSCPVHQFVQLVVENVTTKMPDVSRCFKHRLAIVSFQCRNHGHSTVDPNHPENIQ